MKLKPLQDWALIQRIEPKEMTAAGIIIPDAAKDKPTEGIVLAIGPGKYEAEKGEEKKKEKEKKKKFVATVLTPGQRVIYGKYSAREFELDGETIVLVREEDVLGTVEETQLAQKKTFAVEEKHDRPVTIKEKSEVMTIAAAPVQKKKPAEIKTINKEKPAPKSAKKKDNNKAGTGKLAKKPPKKMSGQKTTEKKTISKKETKKPVKKTTPVKKVMAAEKKAAVKKVSQKKTDIPKKKAVHKATAGAGKKKNVQTKKVATKKKPAVKKPLTKGRPKSGR